MVYDVIIIGAGPAGLFAGWTLEQYGINYCILEKGKNFLDRDKNKEYDVGFGVGGAGLFSDGKLSYPPSASKLWTKGNPKILEKVYKNLKKFFEQNQYMLEDWSEEWIKEHSKFEYKNSENSDIVQKKYKSTFLDESTRNRILSFTDENIGKNIIIGREVCEINKIKKIFIVKSKCGQMYESHNIILAVGKANYIRILNNAKQFKKFFVSEMGIRVSFNNNYLNKKVSNDLDYKVISDIDDQNHVRTFCYCKNGKIAKSLYDDNHVTFNGERINNKNNNYSNIGIVFRTKNINSVYANEMQYIFNNAKQYQYSINEYLLEKNIIGINTDRFLKKLLSHIIKPESKGIVIGPEIEKFGEYLVLNKNLQSIKGLYVIGDSTGIFRGLMAAFISGGYVADIIVEKIHSKLKILENNKKLLNIKTSCTKNMKLVFTAQSKEYFYCRDVVCQFVFEQKGGYLPVNPFRAFGYFLGDRVNRDLVRMANNQLIRTCDELWVFGNISDGVLFEIYRAIYLNKKIRFFTIGNKIEDIMEISIDEIKCEPEVHAKQIKKEDIISFIKNKCISNNKSSKEIDLFENSYE